MFTNRSNQKLRTRFVFLCVVNQQSRAGKESLGHCNDKKVRLVFGNSI